MHLPSGLVLWHSFWIAVRNFSTSSREKADLSPVFLIRPILIPLDPALALPDAAAPSSARSLASSPMISRVCLPTGAASAPPAAAPSSARLRSSSAASSSSSLESSSPSRITPTAVPSSCFEPATSWAFSLILGGRRRAVCGRAMRRGGPPGTGPSTPPAPGATAGPPTVDTGPPPAPPAPPNPPGAPESAAGGSASPPFPSLPISAAAASARSRSAASRRAASSAARRSRSASRRARSSASAAAAAAAASAAAESLAPAPPEVGAAPSSGWCSPSRTRVTASGFGPFAATNPNICSNMFVFSGSRPATILEGRAGQ
mmetsp:Transcript_106929/g.259698  ORF Transcript_106929/g.259698 Transcript_106929/m.259698 type:complete len:317 (-) Transcript_106929:543-1493(-)